MGEMCAVSEGHSPQAGLEPGCMPGKRAGPGKGLQTSSGFLTSLGEVTAPLITLVGGLIGQGNPLRH